MNRITSLSGPRVQPATTNTSTPVSGSRFGSLMQGVSSQAPKAGAQFSGGSVVSSALAQMGATSHGSLVGTYTASGATPSQNMPGIQQPASNTSGGAGQPKSEEQQALEDLATMSAVTMSQSILHMGGMKIDLEKE
ncbi:hypothetical protein D7Y13_03815 [Corallococcus praedator]|uniref:Uncharacterized protein n=1 Tax=Corallococcus praedator TaxID=2316724 RepID=A0ABX9QPL5_9BACT|nr:MULTISPECIES: hypothetical protein [Corallococcus]RKH20866.1 hypothetical protein D7X74_02965 [Corallococcus sp. CA047B]RKH35420.1 hypothetical protein D7X75_04490 [Corallococcus sp. CA031C]RKI15699.1 hypothetical protein D7Y13_03815 [Corallococcus praedator]